MNKIERHICVYYEWWGYEIPLGAVYSKFKDRRYYHRTDGPAYIPYVRNSLGSFNESYWLLDEQITKENFDTPGYIDAFLLEHS
jgi:hypothetical protein